MAVWLNLICKMLEMDHILAPNIMLTPLGPIQSLLKKIPFTKIEEKKRNMVSDSETFDQK